MIGSVSVGGSKTIRFTIQEVEDAEGSFKSINPQSESLLADMEIVMNEDAVAAAERCESCESELVEHYDVEGVPFCKRCWNDDAI